MVRYEHDGKLTVLADRFGAKEFNAPNDVVVHPDGGIWFTDPGYGSLMNYEGNRADTGSVMPIQKEAVYRIDPKSGKVSKATDEIFKPNGLCFSPDYSKLYVADTGASHYPEAPREIKVWNVTAKNTLAGGKTFASMKLETKGKVLEEERMESVATRTETFGRAPVGRVMVLTVCMFSNQGKASGSDRFYCLKSALIFVLAGSNAIVCS